MVKIGIYVGAFDPLHIGHLDTAKRTLVSRGLERMFLLPLPNALIVRDKQLEMLRAAVKAESQFAVCDAVQELCAQFPDAQLHVLLEADAPFDAACLGREVTLETVARDAYPISLARLRRLIAFGCAGKFLPQAAYEYIASHGLYDANAPWKNLPMEQLEPIVVRLLNANRVAHVLGCRDTAVALAKHWGADVEDAARAGILHDITKALDGPLQLTLCDGYGKILSAFSRKYPKTLHALTGSLVAERIFGENEAVVSAICHHTTGKADMSLLEKIIYVADYMEPCRDFPGVERLRELAYSDIDAALQLGLEMTLVHLANLGDEVSPESREALEFLKNRS